MWAKPQESGLGKAKTGMAPARKPGEHERPTGLPIPIQGTKATPVQVY